MKTSLDITIEATTKELNIKSAELFDYFVSIYTNELKKLNFELLTPMDESKRGSHIAISHKEAWRISKCLINPIDNDKSSIIIDFRPNNIIRIALTPLYTSFQDIYSISKRLINIVNEEEFKLKDESMDGVT